MNLACCMWTDNRWGRGRGCLRLKLSGQCVESLHGEAVCPVCGGFELALVEVSPLGVSLGLTIWC